MLVRAIALRDLPLGCAVLTLKDSTYEGRNLSLDRLGYEEHLPKERFIECLEIFAKNMHCTLDTRCIQYRLGITFDDVRSFLIRSPPSLYHPEDVVDSAKGDSSRRHLQSVKEEDSEEVDDVSDDGDGEDNDENIVDGVTESAKRKPSKPSKRSRVA